MAVKDHSLDEKIVKAAREEFLEYGYQKASLHKISAKAGITTGALYTRYRNKDDLFASLVRDVFEAQRGYADEIRKSYEDAHSSRDPQKILEAVRKEEAVYIDLLFSNYDECLLLYCRSAGSTVEKTMNEMMRRKTDMTVEYFRSISSAGQDLDGIGLILSEQFSFYRLILEKGYSREKTIKCMDMIRVYQEAGWKALFEEIL